jgi:hypothetical protein
MANQVWPLLLATSTTSVFLSQCPRESPIQSLMSPPACGRPSSGMTRYAVMVVVRESPPSRKLLDLKRPLIVDPRKAFLEPAAHRIEVLWFRGLPVLLVQEGGELARPG